MPNRTYGIDFSTIELQLDLLKRVQDLSESEFVMFGGDLLNNGDTKAQACYKLAVYSEMMNRYFDNPRILVGNHDTNYQGSTYTEENSYDYSGSMLSQGTINDLLFNGGNSFYCFNTQNTSFYCFDSGIDWFASSLSDYQEEQLRWFAESLLEDDFQFKIISIHMALIWQGPDKTVTKMISEIGRIIEAFNGRGAITVEGQTYDYSLSIGSIEFVQSGRFHEDIDSFQCGGVPIIATTSFASPEAVSKPTFDVVFVDHPQPRSSLPKDRRWR